MAKFAVTKKLVESDYPSQYQPLLSKLFQDLNGFFTATSSALTNGLVLADNSKSVKITANIAVNQVWPMTYNLASLKSRPSVVHIGALKTTDGTSITAAFSVTWSYNDGILSYQILGLSAASKYEVILYAIV